MATQMLCGDEVQGGIIDIGSAYSKFGTSGQDLPRHVFKSSLGTKMTSNNHNDNIKKYMIGDSSLKVCPSDSEVINPFVDGNVNWDAVESILQHGLNNCMRINATEFPLLFAESYFNTLANKAKLAEICFEQLESPAMYVCSNATLGSFSTGRPTGLVLDFGASQTRIVPVVDGYALNKATVTTIRAGNMFDELLARKIESSSGLPVTPWHDRSNHISYQVPTPTNNNNSINPNTSPSTSYINKSSLSGMSMPHISSVRQMFIQDVIRDCKRTSCFIPYKPIAITHNNSPEIFMDSLVVSQFELPDGTYVQPNYNLCTVPERMFFPIYNFLRKRSRQEMYSELLENPFLTPEEFYISTQPSKGTSTDTSSTKVMSTSMPKLDDHSIPLQYLILRSLSQVDTDARKELLHNILLTGGGSLTDGLVPRLSYELTEVLPPQFKTKFVSTLPIEKHYGTWIGGSILGICGSFQQLWVSRQEYEEAGVKNVVRKFIH